MSYLPWPEDDFIRYVRGMSQSEAQTALIYFMNYMAALAAAQWRADQAAGQEVT